MYFQTQIFSSVHLAECFAHNFYWLPAKWLNSYQLNTFNIDFGW